MTTKTTKTKAKTGRRHIPQDLQRETAADLLRQFPGLTNKDLSHLTCEQLAKQGHTIYEIRPHVLADARKMAGTPGSRGKKMVIPAPSLTAPAAVEMLSDIDLQRAEEQDSLIVRALRQLLVAMTVEGIHSVRVRPGKVTLERRQVEQVEL